MCLAFGDDSSFILGNTDWKHIYSRIDEHDKSKIHLNSVDAYLLYKNSASIDTLLTYGRSSIRRSQIESRRQILSRVIDVVKLIGKRNLAYRGHEGEAAYTLNNADIDHGNFLEMILLLSKYDSLLKTHLNIMIHKSQRSHDRGSRQGGGNVTFLSKTTLNHIILAIRELILEKISAEVNEAGMYSVQLDTTQDIMAVEQCSIVARYVHNSSIKERLIGMTKCLSTKGVDIAENFIKYIEKLNLDPKKCVGNATDGASNMQGQYNGFSAKLSEKAQQQIHVWCYAHILNLVIIATVQENVGVISFFQIMEAYAVFMQESHKRMDKWTDIVKKRRLHIIGETRWWSKHTALSTIFGNFNDPKNGVYVELILILHEIKEDNANFLLHDIYLNPYT